MIEFGITNAAPGNCLEQDGHLNLAFNAFTKFLEATMPHYGTLRVHNDSTAEAEDIRGANVYGTNDDKLGKIDDVIFDHTTGNIIYVVIDTGGWLRTKKFLVPANQLSESAKHDHDYVVDLTTNQIEKFPVYKEEDLESEENWGLYEDRYRDAWSEAGVLHQ